MEYNVGRLNDLMLSGFYPGVNMILTFETKHSPLNVKVVHRFIDVLTGTLGLAVLPFGLLHLDVRAVAQHDVTEVGRRLGQIDPAAKAVFAQQRQSSGVVDVGVRDQNKVKCRRLDRQILVDEYVLALLHAEIHQTALAAHLKENGILAVFHYVPLHSAPAGSRFGRFHGEDRYTTNTFERLLRLPMYYGLKPEEVEYIADTIKKFYK